jgi:hypothetical protein
MFATPGVEREGIPIRIASTRTVTMVMFYTTRLLTQYKVLAALCSTRSQYGDNKTTGSEYLRSEKRQETRNPNREKRVAMSPFHAPVDTLPTLPLKKAGQPGKLQAIGVDGDRKKRRENEEEKKRERNHWSCALLQFPGWYEI